MMEVKIEINKEFRKMIDSAVISATNIGANVEIEILSGCKEETMYDNRIIIRFIK